MKLEQLQKLLALANDQPESNEGKSARKIAEKHLRKLGLSEEDVATQEKVILPATRKVWEEALAEVVVTVHPVDLLERTEKGSEGFIIRGSGADVKLVDYRFTTLRRAVLRLGGEYSRSLRMVVGVERLGGLVAIFHNYVVLALSERILSDEIEDSEIDAIVEAEGIVEEEDEDMAAVRELLGEDADGEPEPEPEDGFYDKLLEYAANKADEDFGLGTLDPCVCGYNAGMTVPLTDAIPSETDTTIEEARRLTAERRLIGEDKLDGLDPFGKMPPSPDGW
jgi:hypothetical protein